MSDEVDKKRNIKKKNDKEETKKALFLQRLFAFLIDIFLVSIVASLITFSFVDTDKINVLTERFTDLTNQFMNEEIDIESFTLQYSDVEFSLARLNGIVSLVTIILNILYFVVFQLYRDGQTIGKKIMKIKIKSDNKELTMNQMILRAFIANSILLDLISFAFMVFSNKTIYFYSVGLFSSIQYIITIISIFMVMYSKDGRAIHDRLFHTKVVKNS